MAAIYGDPRGPVAGGVWREQGRGRAPVGASAGAFRQEILDVLGQLLREATLDDLRIAQILTAAKVSRGTFYFYYASKEDAFAALLDQVYARAVPAFEALFADPARRGPRSCARASRRG